MAPGGASSVFWDRAASVDVGTLESLPRGGIMRVLPSVETHAYFC